MVSHAELIDRLRSHRLLKDLPVHEMAWLAAHGHERQLEVGEVLSSKATGVLEELLIVLSGRIALFVDRGTGPRKAAEWKGDEITGRLPYSRQTGSFGEVRVTERGAIITLHLNLFPEMTRACPEFTAVLVQLMLDRARLFTRQDLHDEKMVSLGRLAAGLAHELDNPASALVRGASLLRPALDEFGAASEALGDLRLADHQREAMAALKQACLTAGVRHIRSPLEQTMHEDAISDWLQSRDIDPTGAEALADTSLTIDMLDDLAVAVDRGALEVAVQWIAAGCRAKSLAAELGQAAVRISELVKAVKGFTYLDAAAVPQPIDVEASLTQTLAMIQSKARGNKVGVSISIDRDLPSVQAVGGELNQIWFNLLDNALDAVHEGGSIRIAAARRSEGVVVTIVDDGPGVPLEIQEKIFDPFFTTKPVGSGTGLGLDIVRRLVTQQGGNIEMSSVPGHTEFRVTLPIAPAEAGA